MREAENTTLVKQAYAEFGRGHIQGVLDILHPDVVWSAVTGASPAVPMAGERRGQAAVGEFFNTLGRSMTFEVFEPREFVAQDDKVVALGSVSALYDRHARLLFNLILRILRDRADAEDVLQEVFVAVWTRAESYNPTLGPPAAWLVRIARNRAILKAAASCSSSSPKTTSPIPSAESGPPTPAPRA